MLWLADHSINRTTGRPEAHHLWPFARVVMAMLWGFALAFLALAVLLAASGATAGVALLVAVSAIPAAAAVHHGRVLKRKRRAFGAAAEQYDAAQHRAFETIGRGD